MSFFADPRRRLRALTIERWPTDRVLIIVEEATAIERALELVKEVAPADAHHVAIDTDRHNLRPDIVRAARGGTWLVFTIGGDLTHDAVNLLKDIERYEERVHDRNQTTIGKVRAMEYANDDTLVPLPGSFRLVGIIERAAIERQSYPRFLDLFDTAISVTARSSAS